MTINEIKKPSDILEFMNENIEYGWIDVNGDKHIRSMKDFRKLYRTTTIEETLKTKLGTCIDQVYLISFLLNKIDIPNKMFCTRVYEGNDFNDLEAEERLHCFVLYYLNNKVYQLEHPDWKRAGIYEFNTEEEAIQKINEHYIKLAGGKIRLVTEFFDVEPGISFKEFNEYINSLDTVKKHI